MSAVTPPLPGVKHKVIGLVSGGKDSTFNLLHCVANGHELVAIATLTPEPGTDELDSHLYQSVGTSLLPHLARAMSLPLFSRVIKGKAVSRGAEYGSRIRGGDGSGEEGDETEDLTALLRQVMVSHPEATAVASGAILSNYQRLRIEHVCTRLGLFSLSYLWQQPQLPLLDRMIASGMEVVLVKVAGVGLGVELVGKSIREVRPLLARLERQYGSHPAGEGGEYETLTLSTPLFSHRLHLLKTSTVVTDPEPYPVAYLRVEEAELVEKEGWARSTVQELRRLLGLDEGADGLDENGRERLEEFGEVQVIEMKCGEASETTPNLDGLSLGVDISHASEALDVRFGSRGRWFTASVTGRTRGEEPIGEELRRSFDAISTELTSRGLSLPLHATHITLLLSSMSLFAPANEVYKTFFGTSPPSRATVAVKLPPGERVRLEVVGFDDRPENEGKGSQVDTGTDSHGRDESGHEGEGAGARMVGGRQALHVQGLSYWAPANIGPYSQAVIVNSRVHLAGQIPLLPASLTLPPYPPTPASPYPHQATLALQHVERIVEVLRSPASTGGGWTGWGESCVAWWAIPERSVSGGEIGGREGPEVVRKAWQIWADENGFGDAPVVFTRAKELPRGALVEYQVNLHTGRPGVSSGGAELPATHAGYSVGGDEVDEEDDEDEELRPVYASGGDETSWWESCTASRLGQGSRAMVFVSDTSVSGATSSASLVPSAITTILDHAVAARVYHLTSVSTSTLQDLVERILPERNDSCWTFIPVLDISDRRGRQGVVALEIFGA